MNKGSKEPFLSLFHTVRLYLLWVPVAQHNAAHTNYTSHWLFHFWDLGWCTCVVIETFPPNMFQGQTRNIPMGLRVNIPLLESKSCCFYNNLELSLSFQAFRGSLHLFHCQSFLTMSLRVYFHSTLRPKCVNMKWYNWQKSITKLLSPHVRPIIILNHKWAACLAGRFIHGFSAGSNKPCCKKKKIPKSHKSFERKQ